MPGESLVQVTSGAGPKLHTWQRTVGANNVEDEFTLNAEPPIATYFTTTGSGISIATANSHVYQLMAGASLNVYVRRIAVYQSALATAAAIANMQVIRLTSAGTGGSVANTTPLDTSDAASGAACMTLPTAKGTETNLVGHKTAQFIQTVPTGGTGTATLLCEWDYDRLRSKGLRIPAGAANGIAIKNPIAVANATVVVEIVFQEASY